MGRPARRSPRALTTWLLLAGVLVACGDDEPSTPLPLVAEVAPAVEALDASLGGSQRYFEVNADVRLVNLFVATDDATTATAYVYLDGQLQPPAPPRQVGSGNTFAADAIAFDPDDVLERVAAELPESTIERFVVLGGPDGAVRYEVIVRSRQGGVLSVVVGPDGAVLSVDPL